MIALKRSGNYTGQVERAAQVSYHPTVCSVINTAGHLIQDNKDLESWNVLHSAGHTGLYKGVLPEGQFVGETNAR